MDDTKKRIIGIVAIVAVLAIALGAALIPLALKPAETPAYVTTDEGYVLCQEGKLTFTSEFDDSPFEGKSSTSYFGFTVDLAKAIADKLGLEADFTNQRTLEFLPEMIERYGADVAFSDFNVNGLDDNDMTYTDSYFTYQLALVVIDKSSYEFSHRSTADKDVPDITSTDDLDGQTICVKRGSEAARWAGDNLTNVELVYCDAEEDCMGKVKGGEAIAAIITQPKAAYAISTTYSYLQIAQVIDGTYDYVMALDNGNAKLKEAINQAIADLKADGTYDELYAEYFEDAAE